MKNIFAKALVVFILGVCFTGALSASTYTVSYDVKGDTRRTIALVKPIRMYYHARATAIFDSTRVADGSMRFTLRDIPETGVRVRTHRNGEKLSIVTAAKNINQARAPFAQLEREFKTGVPFYGPMINTVDARPFLIGALSPQSFTFARSANGTHSAIACNVPMITPEGFGPYGDSFNVYPIMGEMLRMFNHDALPAGGLAAVVDGTATRWNSVNLNYTSILNQLLHFADHKAVEHLSFRQARAFQLQYSVESNTGGVITIVGSATPNVAIASGASIRSCRRVVRYRVSDGVLLEDTYTIDARPPNGVGWSFTATLRRQ